MTVLKHFLLTLGLLACVGNAALAQAGPNEDSAAKVIADVNQFSLSQYQGRVVYLDFWASWCGPCRQSFPFMQDLQKRYQAKGLSIVAVNVDAEPEDALNFLKDYDLNFDVVLDSNGSLAADYEIIGMPSSFILNSNGDIIASHAGFQDKDKAAIEQQIVRALEDSKQ